MKQSKLRRRRVVRFTILYFVMLVIFLALMIAPSLIATMGVFDLTKMLSGQLNGKIGGWILVQPVGLKNDDTHTSLETGTGAASYIKTRSQTGTPTKKNNKARATGSMNDEPWRFLM